MRASCLLTILLVGVKLAGGPSPEKMLKEGHRALARGDYEKAVALYQQAELLSTEPAEVAFYLAGAKYHLAKKVAGLSPELLEAEQLYRCCLDFSNPHRPHALCGLGNCLLHKAGALDEGSLRSAISCYDLCLQCAGGDEALAATARHNRERARLMLLQFLPPPSESANNRPLGDQLLPHLPRPDDYHQARQQAADDDGSDGNAASPSNPGDAKQNESKGAGKSNEPPQPGKGNLPPIPDEVDVPPLSQQVASEYLELAAKKVLQERQIHQRRDEETTDKGVKDW